MTETMEATMEKVEVEVGRWMPDGTFTGEILRFTGEEVGSYTDHGLARSGDDRGITYTLYRTKDDGYRVYVKEWSRWEGEDGSATLHPYVVPDSPYPGDPQEYAAYSEGEARRAWPELFAAVGLPTVRDLDGSGE